MAKRTPQRKRPAAKAQPRVKDVVDGEKSPREAREELHRQMMRAVLTEPLLSNIKDKPGEPFKIIIALNEQFPNGREAAQQAVVDVLEQLTPKPAYNKEHPSYVFATLTGKQIEQVAKAYRQELTEAYREQATDAARWVNPVYRVWEDREVRACLTKSRATIKADASHKAFDAMGRDIMWAVLDSGIDAAHAHFHFDGMDSVDATLSKDYTKEGGPFVDRYGHGTHVAGIIAGRYEAKPARKVIAAESLIEGTDNVEVRLEELSEISGVAPLAKLVSLKVLDGEGKGDTSALLLAINYIQTLNQHGRRLRIHGANISVGYDFDPRWFGCGQSPLCVEVDRLVKSGVVVVVAAGNAGFSGVGLSTAGTNELGYRAASIKDPGNAELAITVGSTHRDMPHTYGVSYFSSRGPTGDGRLKPDLVAPGERIISCAAGSFLDERADKVADKVTVGAGKGQAAGKVKGEGKAEILYLDQSGTSMAAPHVSGAIAAFLSVRREFIGQPEKVKQLFLDCAVDLKRERSFQGHGLLDLVKVLQAV